MRVHNHRMRNACYLYENGRHLKGVEYVKQEAKLVYLLECLQKTPPPVLIFCENKADVDDIHEYLLLKGVEAVAIHGGKDQEEREYAISSFKAEIENYVHRIGRTGRCGKTGIATTFINKNQSETTLLDSKHLLQEAKERIPQVLADKNGKSGAKVTTRKKLS